MATAFSVAAHVGLTGEGEIAWAPTRSGPIMTLLDA
jgi:hypothetical protein